MPEKLTFTTHAQLDMIDITGELASYLVRNSNKGWKNGLICVFSPHTSCAVTINEGYDPDVRSDMLSFMASLVPNNWGFHHSEGNSDAHVKTSMFGSSCFVPVEDGRLALGKWQAVYLFEGDGPRLRTIKLFFIPAE